MAKHIYLIRRIYPSPSLQRNMEFCAWDKLNSILPALYPQVHKQCNCQSKTLSNSRRTLILQDSQEPHPAHTGQTSPEGGSSDFHWASLALIYFTTTQEKKKKKKKKPTSFLA